MEAVRRVVARVVGLRVMAGTAGVAAAATEVPVVLMGEAGKEAPMAAAAEEEEKVQVLWEGAVMAAAVVVMLVGYTGLEVALKAVEEMAAARRVVVVTDLVERVAVAEKVVSMDKEGRSQLQAQVAMAVVGMTVESWGAA